MKTMIFTIALIISALSFNCNNKNDSGGSTAGEIRVIKNDLSYPWEIIWGKDNHIWMSERGGRISRIDPANGNRTLSFNVTEVEQNNEGGMLGMVLHPDFQNNGYLYVAYNYRSGGNYREKLVRYTYANNTLSSPFTLIEGIEGSSIHNGSRLWITEAADPKIFMTTGDAANQGLPQQTNTRNGKVLRLNLDGSFPADNPFPNNPVWSFGHRNQQGLVMVNGILYASEHGPSIEDEVNIIEKGRNYGWPEVNGPCNGSETSFCNANNVKQPIWSSGNNTIAVCGLDYYNHNLIPAWKNSLLMMTLKNSTIVQLKLSTDGRSVVQTVNHFNNKWGRLRDICVSPTGKVYVCTSNGGNSDELIEISRLD